jgi:HEAT repeat protein
MASRFFCPSCWKEIEAQIARCPYCGYFISRYDACSFEEKLIHALRHPIRENRMMAIQLLGEIKSEKAVLVFASILESENDFYVIREIINSLNKIGSFESMDLIRKMNNHPSKLVSNLVQEMTEMKK